MSTEPGSTRARGRELALLALCHLESYEADEREQALALLWNNAPVAGEEDAEWGPGMEALLSDDGARRFADELLADLLAHWAGTDEAIESASDRWRLERIDRIERNVLRLAACELAHRRGTPRAAVVSEAVRLAERYGGERSARFVNGLAETLARRLRDPEEAAPEAAPEAATEGSDD
jgi:N utilization substance protein B